MKYNYNTICKSVLDLWNVGYVSIKNMLWAIHLKTLPSTNQINTESSDEFAPKAKPIEIINF